MDISITTTNISIDQGSRGLIEDRIEAALDRFSADIVSVSATLSDQNGPKGGRDIRCVLTLRGRRFRNLVAIADGDNAEHSAIVAARKMADRVRKEGCLLSDHRGRIPQPPLVPETEPLVD
ncbi:MAG: ribosome-associated translation inhibitor RaiA [Bradymonadia bacterium]|jgi:ribosome-associated translation inhibitor RaiA